MGGWKLEVAKMTFYMAFPVAMFWLANQPKLMDPFMIQFRERLEFTPDPEMQRLLKENRIKQEQKRQARLEKLIEEEEKAMREKFQSLEEEKR